MNADCLRRLKLARAVAGLGLNRNARLATRQGVAPARVPALISRCNAFVDLQTETRGYGSERPELGTRRLGIGADTVRRAV
jgi:hypothetical protein